MHALVDELPDQLVAELHAFALTRRTEYDASPFASMSEAEREQLQRALCEGEAELARGEGLSPESAKEAVRKR